MTPQFINELLKAPDLDNYKKAFQILFKKKEVLKDIYPMVLWALRVIRNSPFSLALQSDLKYELTKLNE